MFKVLTEGCEPTRGSKYSACVDLYASHDITIGVGETAMVGLGVCVDLKEFRKSVFKSLDSSVSYFPIKNQDSIFDSYLKSHYLQLILRSSLGKKELIIPNGVGVIDLDYEDEIKLMVHNPITDLASSLNTKSILLGFDLSKQEISKKDIEEAQRDLIRPHLDDFIFTIKKGDKIAQITLLEHKSYLFDVKSDAIRGGGAGSADA